MALIDIGTADGTIIGNPSTGNYFLFLDSNNSDRLTIRDELGFDTIYTTGVIPTQLSDLSDVAIAGLTDNQILVSSGGVFQNQDKSVFGTELNFYRNDALNTNTNNAVGLDVLNVNTSAALPVGFYLLHISANVSCNATNSDGIVNFTFDGAPISGTTGNNELYRLEFKEAGGNNPQSSGTDQKDTFSLHFPIRVTNPTVKNIVLSIIPEAIGVEMNMWNAAITLFRIS